MSQYRPRTQTVDAVQVQFGKRGWPDWLKGRAFVHSATPAADVDAAGHPFVQDPQEVKDGDYLVHSGGGVIDVMRPDDFKAKFAAVRNRKQEPGE